MKCPSCQSEISPDAGICLECTREIPAVSTEFVSATSQLDFARQVDPNSTKALRAGADTAIGADAATDHVSISLPAGELINERYRIVRLLGRGGMGVVYHADDLTLGVAVALKFLSAKVQRDHGKLERFLNEVRLARQISHANVCRVFDVSAVDGRHFLSMEWVDGEDLASLLKRVGRLSRPRALRIGLEVCRGLAAAHSQGILHRDLKPANLMIDADGRARISDFGLASLADEPDEVGVVAGTLNYMAPEQGLGAASVKSDLFSLGLVLYELFNGDHAFARPQVFRHQNPDPPKPMIDRDLDPGVEKIVMACLQARPENRPASAQEVAAVFERASAPPWRPISGAPIPHRNHWQLERRLGEGGFGEAWLAVHRKTQQQRVFKFCNDVTKLRSFEREITLFRLLMNELGKREDIVSLIDWSLEEPPYFIEAEYIEGGNLRHWFEAQGGGAKVPVEDRIEIVAQVATALAAAHSVAVVHKDVKPTNVLIEEVDCGPRAQLCDFGIAAATERGLLEAADITVLGMTEMGDSSSGSSYGGTRLYMAPEVLEGREATVQSDVYSLGVVLYQLLVDDFSRSLASGWRRDIEDPLLADDIAAAADGSPQHRPSAAQFAERLRALPERRQQVLTEERLRTEASAAVAELKRANRRRKWVASGLGFLLILAAALAYLFERGSTSAQDAVIEQTLNGLEGMASVTASALSRNMAAIERRIEREASRPELARRLTTRNGLDQYITSLYQRYDDRSFHSWVLADASGRVVACHSQAGGSPSSCIDDLHDEWFSGQPGGSSPRGHVGLTAAFRPNGSEHPLLMHAAAPLPPTKEAAPSQATAPSATPSAAAGRPAGVLSTAVDLESLNAWLGEAEAEAAGALPPGACPDRFFLLVYDDQLIRHPCPDPATPALPVTEGFASESVRELLEQGVSEAFDDPMRPQVKDDLAVAMELAWSPSWQVVVVQSRQKALQPVTALTHRVRTLGQIATVVAAFLFALLVLPMLWRAWTQRAVDGAVQSPPE